MPVREKLSQVFHRKSSIPEAPALPGAPLSQSTMTSQPLTNEMLMQQRGVLHETVYDSAPLASNFAQESTTSAALLNQEAYIGTGNRSSLLLRQEPTIVERIERDIVVQERIHPIEKEEIQPIIYREREQLDVKQITQMMHETQVQPTMVQQRELAPEYREAVIERAAPLPSNIVLPTREIEATATSREIRAPIVEETIKKTVIEEVQPVIERDVIAPTVIQQTQPIFEKIIEAPTITREIRGMQELGTRGLGNETVYNASIGQQYKSQYSSSAYTQEDLLARERLASQERLSAQERSFSNSSYEMQMREQQLLNDQQMLQGQNRLATGQVLPNVASSRPTYAYLPSGYAEKRPDFVGSASQYVVNAKNVPLTHNRGLHTLNNYGQPAPQNILRQ